MRASSWRTRLRLTRDAFPRTEVTEGDYLSLGSLSPGHGCAVCPTTPPQGRSGNVWYVMENSEIDGPMPVREEDVRDACEQNKGAMFQVCRRMLPDKSDAEDALSQAILNALSYPPGSIRIDLKFWLLAVARNAAK